MSNCVFCGRQAVSKNEQKFPVCVVHKKQAMQDMKCVCGQILSIKESKYGPFFLCFDCGPVSINKAMNMNEVKTESEIREITMRSDEVDFL